MIYDPAALVGPHDGVEGDLVGGGPLHGRSVPDDGDVHHIVVGVEVDGVVSGGHGPVAALGSGDPLHQVEGLQRLHLVSYGAGVPVDDRGDLLPLNGLSLPAL